MPDWAIHLAAGAGFGKALRIRNLHVFILGAVVPDFAAIFGTLSDFNWLPVDSYRVVFFAVPFGSLFGAVCLCSILACWLSRPWPALFLLIGGVATHFLLDICQIGHVDMLAYPFSFDICNLSLLDYTDNGLRWLTPAALFFLLLMRFIPMERDIWFSVGRACWLSILPLALLLAVMVANESRLLDENKFDLQFLRGDAVAENSPVTIRSGLVVKSRPLIVKKIMRQIEVVWPGTVPEGKLVFVRGRFINNKIAADSVVQLAAGRKVVFSVLAALLLISFWLKIPFLDDIRNYVPR